VRIERRYPAAVSKLFGERAGLDLRPIDIRDREQVAWLEALVWPDEGNRMELLRAALKVAQHYTFQIVQGDLRTDLPALVAQMPEDATRVVFHTAVIGYLSSANERSAAAEALKDLDVVWVSNEPPEFLPELSKKINNPGRTGCFCCL
jgi:hypothetical protein